MAMKKAILSGYNLIDEEFGGLTAGELTLIGGRPSMGKTALALQIALNVAKSGKSVKYISSESSAVDLELRLISIISGISFMKIRKWDMSEKEWELFKKTTKEIKMLPLQLIFADDMRVIKYHCEGSDGLPVDLIIYDYLQLIHNRCTETKDGAPDRTSVEYLNKLKTIGRKHKIPVIVLTQLSRNLERRKDKHPKISDIRVDNLTDDAYDQAILIYRDAYYSIDAPSDKAELRGISKKKNIDKTCAVHWNREKGIFEDVEFV